MYLDHIGTVDMFGAGYSLCSPCEHMAEVYSDIQPSQYFTFPISILSLRASFYRHQYSFDSYYSTLFVSTIVLFRLSTRQKSMVYGPQWLRHGRER